MACQGSQILCKFTVAAALGQEPAVLESRQRGCPGHGEERAVRRDSPSRAAGSSPDPCDSYGGAATRHSSRERRGARRDARTALFWPGPLWSVGQDVTPQRDTNQHGQHRLLQGSRGRAGPWVIPGTWGRHVATDALEMPRGEGGSKVTPGAPAHALAPEGRRCIVHGASHAGCLAEGSCSRQLAWLSSPRPQGQTLTAGRCRPRAFSPRSVSSASPPPALRLSCRASSGACVAQPGGATSGADARSPWPSSCRRVRGAWRSVWAGGRCLWGCQGPVQRVA